jgi:hypothetical protein
MKALHFAIGLFAVSALAALATPPAEGASAPLSRTWVSGTGSDSNACTRSAPCLTFAGAILKTQAGGEIDALDAGDYGQVTVTKSITIDGGSGKVATILVTTPNSAGIGVEADPTGVVTLRNLSIVGTPEVSGPSAGGILLLEAAALHIEHCVIRGFGAAGIAIKPLTQPTHGSQVFIDDTVIQDGGANGLVIEATGTSVHVSVSNSRFTGNAKAGVLSGSYSRTTIRNSESSGNAGWGFVAQAMTGTANLDLVDSLATNNISAGVLADGALGASTVRLANVTLYADGSGLVTVSGGIIYSFGNNNNGSTGAPSGIIAPQ